MDWVEEWLREHPKPVAVTPAEMTPAQRIWDAYRYATANPDEWRQSNWGETGSCGTTYCLAGHMLRRAGLRLIPDPWGAGPSGLLPYVPLDDMPPDMAVAAQEERRAYWCPFGRPVVTDAEWAADHLLQVDRLTGSDIWFCIHPGVSDAAKALRDRITKVFGPDPGDA